MAAEGEGARVVHADEAGGIVLMLLAAFCLYQSWHLPFGTVSAPDAGFFPRCLSVILLLFGAAITVQAFARAPQPVRFGDRLWHVAIAAVTFIVYAVTVQHVGYVIATFVVLLLLMRVLGGMSWTRSLLIAVPCVALSYLAFTRLGVPLPSGVLPF
jgi:putative tricarboxylic transport membrane protein